jgi:hypothetical protein
MKGLYVYALVPPDVRGALGAGLTDEPLALAHLGPIAAVVGEMEDRPSIAPASLRAHEAVVRRVASMSDAILPLRFGAMATSASELEEGLAPRFEALSRALERTRGCDQMTLRLDAAQAPELDRLVGALGPLARAEAMEHHGPPRAGTSVFHLVERPRIGEYRARVAAMAPELAPRLTITGPWPPYAFTELE